MRTAGRHEGGQEARGGGGAAGGVQPSGIIAVQAKVMGMTAPPMAAAGGSRELAVWAVGQQHPSLRGRWRCSMPLIGLLCGVCGRFTSPLLAIHGTGAPGGAQQPSLFALESQKLAAFAANDFAVFPAPPPSRGVWSHSNRCNLRAARSFPGAAEAAGRNRRRCS